MKISTTNEGICVELRGKEQFWALRAKIAVPLETIESLSFEPQFSSWRKVEVRMPGTNAPRLLLAGSYWTEEGWDFLYIKRPIGFYKPKVHDVLVIETTENRYKRVIVTCDQKEAQDIIKWWQKASKK